MNDSENASEQQDDPASKFSRSLESLLIGMIDFLLRYLRTFFACIFTPSRVIADLESALPTRKYTRPYTFLVVSSILGGSVLSRIDLNEILRGQSVISEIEANIQIDSPSRIIGSVLPVLLVAVPIILILSTVLSRRISGLRSLPARFLCVCSGCQLFFMFILYLYVFLYSLKMKSAPPFFNGPVDKELNEGPLFYCVVIGLTSISMISIIHPLLTLVNRYMRSDRRISRFAQWQITVFMAILFGAVPVVADFGVLYYGFLREADETPHIKYRHFKNYQILAEASISRTNGVLRMVVLIENDRDQALIFPPDVKIPDITIRNLDSGDLDFNQKNAVASVYRRSGDPVVVIGPGERDWFIIETGPNQELALLVDNVMDGFYGRVLLEMLVIECSLEFHSPDPEYSHRIYLRGPVTGSD